MKINRRSSILWVFLGAIIAVLLWILTIRLLSKSTDIHVFLAGADFFSLLSYITIGSLIVAATVYKSRRRTYAVSATVVAIVFLSVVTIQPIVLTITPSMTNEMGLMKRTISASNISNLSIIFEIEKHTYGWSSCSIQAKAFLTLTSGESIDISRNVRYGATPHFGDTLVEIGKLVRGSSGNVTAEIADPDVETKLLCDDQVRIAKEISQRVTKKK